jgi:dTDP-4-amino-4,6-dideoxygalactose transaminase
MNVPAAKVVFPEEDQREIIDRIRTCLSSGRISQGVNTREFEETFARYVGVRHAVSVSSGGAALEIAMRLLDVKDREVLVPTNTFVASATSVVFAGGHVRFVDADARTFAVSRQALEAAVSPRTVGVVLVHVGGIITPDIEAIRAWCDSRGLWLFEDAAHAHGSALNGRMAGRFGVAGAYSFFATKVMTAGEGGMLVTDDPTLADRARGLRDYGKPDPWVSFHTQVGANWRMSELSAAVGVVQLKRLEEFIGWRARVAAFYTRALRDVAGVEPVVPADRSSWYKYIVLLPSAIDRDRLRAAMKASNVALSGGVYDTPLHQQPVFRGAAGEFPIAEEVCARHICLPLYYGMAEDEAGHVVDSLRGALAEQGGHG